VHWHVCESAGVKGKTACGAKADFGEAGMAHVAAVALRAEGRQ
jgi:hypothetical protein